MNESETATSIAALASADKATRMDAAAALYQVGHAAALAATARWREEAELAALFTSQSTVGVAVHPQHFERIHQVNGSPALADVPPDQDAREFELDFPGGISLDILTTRQPHGSGAIARFLDRRGEGIQQVELGVTDIERASTLLRKRFSIAPVYGETRAGADGTRVNFFLLPVPTVSGAATSGKILIELVEAATGKD